MQEFHKLFSKSYIVTFNYLSSYIAPETCHMVETPILLEYKFCVDRKFVSSNFEYSLGGWYTQMVVKLLHICTSLL